MFIDPDGLLKFKGDYVALSIPEVMRLEFTEDFKAYVFKDNKYPALTLTTLLKNHKLKNNGIQGEYVEIDGDEGKWFTCVEWIQAYANTQKISI